MNDITTKLRRAVEFDGNRFHGSDHRRGGARENERLQPLIEKLIACVKALEVGDYYNAEIQDVVDSGMRKKVENHEERSSRMMREALAALQAEVDKLEGK